MDFGWGESQDAHRQVYQQGGGHRQPKQTKFSNKLIASAAAFEGMKLFENNLRKEGKPVTHAEAKDLLAAFASGEVDKLAEARRMTDPDKQVANGDAKEKARKLYSQHQQQNASDNWYDPKTTEYPQQLNYGGN